MNLTDQNLNLKQQATKMMFLKFFCCRESLMANISIGEIKNKDSNGSPVLEVQVQLTLGSIRQSTDFLYL